MGLDSKLTCYSNPGDVVATIFLCENDGNVVDTDAEIGASKDRSHCKPTLDISRLKCRLLLQLAQAVFQAVVFGAHAG